jgi:hypothetical protein
MTYVKISDTNIQDISSTQSNSSSRITTNDNFKKIKKTISSVWSIIDNIYDYNNDSLGSIRLHSDVSDVSPLAGQVLMFDGIRYVPTNISSVGSGDGANYLWQLLDIEDFTYPLDDNSVLVYDILLNKFKPQENKFINLKDIVYQTGIPQIFYKNDDDEITFINIGGAGSFIKSNNSGGISFGSVNLEDIGDISLPDSPSILDEYVLGYNTNGSYSIVPIKSGKSGIRNYIPDGISINVVSGFQYIVYESFDIDGGELDIDGGELIIL